MNKVRTVIFAKAPLAGQAKTRLIPALGRDGSARVARQLLEHTVEQVVAANIGAVELCVSPATSLAIWSELAIPKSVFWSEQGPGDLGQRLSKASQRVTQGAEALLLVGTDCPELDVARLREAANALRSHDACLVPVSDGGYALLGLHQHLPSVFSDMPWSTDQVAELTCRRIAAAGRSLKVMSSLHDIDEPEDLQWLPQAWKTVDGELGY